MVEQTNPANIAPIDKDKVRRNMNWARVRKNLTQDALAGICGVPRGTIAAMETRCPARVPFTLVMSVATALEVDPVWLLGYSDEMPEGAVLVTFKQKSGKTLEVIMDKEDYERMGGIDAEYFKKKRRADYKTRSDAGVKRKPAR